MSKRTSSTSSPLTPKKFNLSRSPGNLSFNSSIFGTPRVVRKIDFQPYVHGCCLENLPNNGQNTGSFIVLGHSFLPAQETLKKVNSVRSIYIADQNSNIGELLIFGSSSEDSKIIAGDIIKITNFSVDGVNKDCLYKVNAKLENVSVNEAFNIFNLPFSSPNTGHEMLFAYSNCQLRYVRTDEMRTQNGTHVKNVIFETEDKKKVQLAYWNEKIVQFPTFELFSGKVYKISGATKATTQSKIYDFSLRAIDLTEVEELVDEEVEHDDGKMPKFDEISEIDLKISKKGTFTAVTDSIENTKDKNWIVGITDGSVDDNGKLLAMECVTDTLIKKGDKFNCIINVTEKDNNRHHGSLTQIEIIPAAKNFNKCKFI